MKRCLTGWVLFLLVAGTAGCGTSGSPLPGMTAAVTSACQTSWGLTNDQLLAMVNSIDEDKGQGISAENMRQSLNNQCEARGLGDSDEASCKECSNAIVDQVYGL